MYADKMERRTFRSESRRVPKAGDSARTEGSAKFGFVGLNRATGNITTFHIKTAQELAQKVPSMFAK